MRKRVLTMLAIITLTFQAEVFATLISNPSFEEGLGSNDPPGWLANLPGSSTSGNLRRVVIGTNAPPYWSTDGSNILRTWSANQYDISAGEYLTVYQPVDLTKQTVVLFDAMLFAPSEWNNFIEAQFAVDDVVLWTGDAAGTYLDQSVDISGLTGIHNIELRMTAVESGSFRSQWILWDNVRIIPEPTTLILLTLGSLSIMRRARRF